MAKLVKPDSEKINDLCNKKNWGPTELANATGLDLRTVAKVLRGEPCFRRTVNIVAQALGKEGGELLVGGQKEGSSAERKEEKRYKVIFVFAGTKKEDFDEEMLQAIADKIDTLIGGSGDIDMEDIKDGSTILTFSLSFEDIYLLLVFGSYKDEICKEIKADSLTLDWQTISDLEGVFDNLSKKDIERLNQKVQEACSKLKREIKPSALPRIQRNRPSPKIPNQ